MSNSPLDYVQCGSGSGCWFYKRRDDRTQCRCAAKALGKLEEDVRCRVLNGLNDALDPRLVKEIQPEQVNA